MRKVLFVLAALALMSLSAAAQSLQVYGGYSLYRPSTEGVPALTNALGGSAGTKMNLNGWDGEVQARVLPFISLVGDVSGNYNTSDFNGTSVESSVYNFLAGPRVSFKVGKITPFAHALFGVQRSRANSTQAGVDITDNHFATALGGGVDFNIAPFIALRPVKLDYVLVNSDSNLTGLNHTNNLRYSAGVVFHF